MLAAPWSDGQVTQDALAGGQPAGWPGGPARPGPLPLPRASLPAAAQPQSNYPPGMLPGTMSSTATIKPPAMRKRRRTGSRVLLVFVLLLAVLAGAWFFGVRPYLHNLALNQLDQALNEAEGQMLLFQLALPPGKRVVHVDESSINVYLGAHNADPLQGLHANLTTAGMNLSFTAYGLGCAVSAVPIASNGQLQVKDVQVQGLLGLILSNDELTTALNSNFQNFGSQMNRKVDSITLHEHEMDIVIG